MRAYKQLFTLYSRSNVQTLSRYHPSPRKVISVGYSSQVPDIPVDVLFSDLYENEAQISKSKPIEAERTFTEPIVYSKKDPAEHGILDIGHIYCMKPEHTQDLNLQLVLRDEYNKKVTACHEAAILIRAHVVETLMTMRAQTKDSTAPRVLFYGRDGSGKSISLAHCMDAACSAGWFVVHPIRHYNWNHFYKEIAPCNFKNTRTDMPPDGVDLLTIIKKMNRNVLTQHGDQIETQHEYTWSRREISPAGTSLNKLIDFGIERPKYSNDVVGALFKELRLCGDSWPIPTLVAVDGANSFTSATNIKYGEGRSKRLPATRLSLVHHFMRLIKSERKNGLTLLTVDVRANEEEERDSYLPKYLLKEEGFEMVDPFLPVEVPNYDHHEINKVLDYLCDIRWIQTEQLRTESGRKELIFMSNHNPFYLEKLTRSL